MNTTLETSAPELLKSCDEWLKQELSDEVILDECCRRDPLYWARNWTKTENPHYLQQDLPFRGPFPAKNYFAPLFHALATETRLFIPKTREMLTSWAVMVWAAHAAQWKKAEVIVQTDSEEKAKQL